MDTNRSSLRFQAEDTWGVLPITPALAVVRITGESLTYEKESIKSEEIRSDRQTSDKIKVGAQASGGINFELTYTQYREFIKRAIYADAESVLNVDDVECGINHTTGVVTGAAGTFTNAIVGSFVRIQGATTGANNGLKLVTAKANDGSSITCAAGSFTATEAAVDLTIDATVVQNGVTPGSFVFERQVPKQGGGNCFELFSGMQIDTFNLTVESKQIVTGEMGFLGKISADSEASFNGATPITASPTDSPVNGTNNLSLMSVNNAATSEKFRRITMEINNGLRGRDALGTEGNWSVGLGSFTMTGQLDAFFRNNDLKAAVKNHTSIGIAFIMTDKAGNSIGVNMPAVVLDDGNNPISGKDDDVMVTCNYEAIMHPTLGRTVIVSYVPAPSA